MKCVYVFVLLMMVVLPARAEDINPEIKDKLCKISVQTELTAKNTEPTPLGQTDFDELLNITLSLFAAFGTVLTWRAVKRESRQSEINVRFQKQILTDLIRHFYRNKVCVCATKLKLDMHDYQNFYPSEEHLLKLKVLPEDTRFDRFSNTPEHYDVLHALELKFRNFNIEVDVALDHLKSRQIGSEIKKRDLDVLEFKSEYLTKEILSLMAILDFGISSEDIAVMLAGTSERYSDTQSVTGGDGGDSGDGVKVPQRTRRYYDDELGLREFLDRDIRNEYPKIGLIGF